MGFASYNIFEDAKATYKTLKSGTDCPPDEMLLDYACEDILTEDEKRAIYEHIQECERCHVEVLKMEAGRTEWEYMINKNPDAALAKALGDIENSEFKIPEKILEIIKDYSYILEEAKKNYNTLKAATDCPPDEELLDYVCEDILTEDEKRAIYEHIQECERCHLEVLKMEADRAEWEYMVNKTPDAALTKALGTSGLKKTLNFKKRMIKEIQGLKAWISSLWEPQWAGVPANAAEIPEQTHSLTVDDGEIKISCYWKPKFRNDPAYIHLSWSARITKPVRLWARFVNPESNEIRSEICLGTRLEGEESFTSDRLGFDPSNEKWAISIIFQEEK